jgi:hypothetical protein
MNTFKPGCTAPQATAAVLAGQPCPVTGWWRLLQPEEAENITISRFVGEGSLLPSVDGTSNLWVPSSHAFHQSDY